jgi:hypothetical protein
MAPALQKSKALSRGSFSGTDALDNVSENAGVFTAAVKNLQSGITLSDTTCSEGHYSITVRACHSLIGNGHRGATPSHLR